VLVIVERVAHLRHSALFADTPDRVLAGLAVALDEVDLAAGEQVMQTGAVEDWLYIVVSGEVEVTRPDRVVRLGPGAVVGELAVLDPQARSATVTALVPTLAFRLRKAAFDEALAARPEIARSVIAELVRRLREAHEPPVSA